MEIQELCEPSLSARFPKGLERDDRLRLDIPPARPMGCQSETRPSKQFLQRLELGLGVVARGECFDTVSDRLQLPPGRHDVGFARATGLDDFRFGGGTTGGSGRARQEQEGEQQE